MAEQQQRPGRARRFFSEVVDRMFLANRGHNYQTGAWDTGGSISGGIQGALGTFLGPLASAGYGLWANADRRRGGDGIPFFNVGGNPIANHVLGGNMTGTMPGRPAGVAGGGPVGVAPAGGGLASYVGQIGAGAAGNQPGQMPISQVTPDGVGRVQHSVSYMPGRAQFSAARPMAPTNMGGARGTFNHGGSVITDGDAIARQMAMIPMAEVDFRYGLGQMQS